MLICILILIHILGFFINGVRKLHPIASPRIPTFWWFNNRLKSFKTNAKRTSVKHWKCEEGAVRINSPWTPNVDTACQRQNRFPSCGCCRHRRGGGERHVGPRSAHGLPWNPDLLTIWSHYLGRNLIPPHHPPPRPFPVLLSLKCWLVNLATGFGALFRACKHPLMGKLNICCWAAEIPFETKLFLDGSLSFCIHIEQMWSFAFLFNFLEFPKTTKMQCESSRAPHYQLIGRFTFLISTFTFDWCERFVSTFFIFSLSLFNWCERLRLTGAYP